MFTFSNLFILHFPKSVPFAAEQLETALAQRPSTPLADCELSRHGWVPPVGKGDDAPLVHAANGSLLFCLKREERLLPMSVVNLEVAERAEAIEAQRGSPVRRAERDDLRDQVLKEFLPRAFTRATRTYAYIDTVGGWLVIDTASADKCDGLVSLLRQCMGSLPVMTIAKTQARADETMTHWLQHAESFPPKFVAQSNCRLKSLGQDGSEVAIRKGDLSGEEIQVHLNSGKEVQEIGLEYDNRLSFTLTSLMRIKRFKLLDVAYAEGGHQDCEDAAAQFDADFYLITTELGRFIPDLLAAFGGLVNVEGV